MKTLKIERKAVYSIEESEGRTYHKRIGTAFVNQDNSLSIMLNEPTKSLRLIIRDEPQDQANKSEQEQE